MHVLYDGGDDGGDTIDIKTLDQVRTVPRNQEVPHEGNLRILII